MQRTQTGKNFVAGNAAGNFWSLIEGSQCLAQQIGIPRGLHLAEFVSAVGDNKAKIIQRFRGEPNPPR